MRSSAATAWTRGSRFRCGNCSRSDTGLRPRNLIRRRPPARAVLPMSVYTPVTAEEFSVWLTRYGVGALLSLEPIATGIENTNFYVTTARGHYVLTLYERLPADELPFYLNLMAHLARAGVECPAPEPDRSGALFSMLNGKPACLVTQLDGKAVAEPSVEH